MEIEAIQKLIDFDKVKREQVEAVHEKKFKLKQDIDAQKEALSKKAWEETNAKVEKRKAELDETIVLNRERTKKCYEENAKRLNDVYIAKKDEWVQMLTRRVIDGSSYE